MCLPELWHRSGLGCDAFSDWHQLFSKVGMGGERTFWGQRGERKEGRNSGLLGLSFSAIARPGVII